jgi:transposase
VLGRLRWGNNPVRVVEAFIDELDLAGLGFAGVVPEATGRPSYHPATLLKIYLYGYLNRIASSRRLEREAHRNIDPRVKPAGGDVNRLHRLAWKTL